MVFRITREDKKKNANFHQKEGGARSNLESTLWLMKEIFRNHMSLWIKHQ